jgi:hypothetical protein
MCDRGEEAPYQNVDFIKGFSQSFVNVVVSSDPNIKVDPTNIVPEWPVYSSGSLEMVFNKTELDEPDIHTRPADEAKLARCQLWHSLAPSTSQ